MARTGPDMAKYSQIQPNTAILDLKSAILDLKSAILDLRWTSDGTLAPQMAPWHLRWHPGMYPGHMAVPWPHGCTLAK